MATWKGYASKAVDDAVNCDATATFTQRDWLDLAMAALDQAGLSLAEQDRIRALLPNRDAS